MGIIRKFIKHHSQEDEVFYKKLKQAFRFSPKNILYYKKAFTHKSIKDLDPKGNPINYERLEFLGDAMLGAVIAAYLFNEAPKETEGYLTKMRSKIVNRKHLNTLGKDLNLIRFVKSNINETNIGDDIHGNIFEAFIGAIYLDKGYRFCEKFIHKIMIVPYVDLKKLESKISSYKGLLIEWCQKQKKKYSFENVSDSGNENIKHFSISITIDGEKIAKGRATSKKKAEELAAKRAYFSLQDKMNKA